MRWILLDVALALACLALLVTVALGLWRRAQALGRAVRVATAQLDASRQPDPPAGRQPPDLAAPAARAAAPSPRFAAQGRPDDSGVRSTRSS